MILPKAILYLLKGDYKALGLNLMTPGLAV